MLNENDTESLRYTTFRNDPFDSGGDVVKALSSGLNREAMRENSRRNGRVHVVTLHAHLERNLFPAQSGESRQLVDT